MSDETGIVHGRYHLEIDDIRLALGVHPLNARKIVAWRGLGVFAALPLVHGLAVRPDTIDGSMFVFPALWVLGFVLWRARARTHVGSMKDAQRDVSVTLRDTGLRIADANGEARELVWSSVQELVLARDHAFLVFARHVDVLPRRAFAHGDFERAVALIEKKVGRARAPRSTRGPMVLAIWLGVIVVLYGVYRLVTDR